MVHASAFITVWADQEGVTCSADSPALMMLRQDLADLSIDAVQGYMLPWDVRRLVAALSNVLSPEQSSYGCFEPSLFCAAKFVLPDGWQLLLLPCLMWSSVWTRPVSCNSAVNNTALCAEAKY